MARRNKELQDRNDELEARLHGGVADRGSSSSSRERVVEGGRKTPRQSSNVQVSLDPSGQKNMKRKGSPVKIQENCFSSLESPRVQKLRKRPEYIHMHSLQNELSFVTRMPGSTESSISSLGDCEVDQVEEEEVAALKRKVAELENALAQNHRGGREAWACSVGLQTDGEDV